MESVIEGEWLRDSRRVGSLIVGCMSKLGE